MKKGKDKKGKHAWPPGKSKARLEKAVVVNSLSIQNERRFVQGNEVEREMMREQQQSSHCE